MRFTVDSNILVYGFIRDDERKHAIASDIIIRAMVLDCVLTAQSIAEFLNVIRRKRRELFEEARAQADRWMMTFTVLDTTGDHILKAADFAVRHRLQLWDCIIWQVARSAHAIRFLSENLQDGLDLEGMRVIDPFNPANDAKLRDLLAEASE